MAKRDKKKLPKHIAGVKIPKKVRKKGGALLAASQTPLGAQVMGGGFVALVSALARSQWVRERLAEAGYELKETVNDASTAVARLADRDREPEAEHDGVETAAPFWSPERTPA